MEGVRSKTVFWIFGFEAKGDNQPVIPVQQLRFTAGSCNGWANSLSNPVRAFERNYMEELWQREFKLDSHMWPSIYKKKIWTTDHNVGEFKYKALI